MTKIYLGCAVLGGVLLGFQLLLSLLGLHGHGDFGGSHGADLHGADHAGEHGAHETGANWLLGFVTFRNLVAGLTFFGLVGMAATSAHWSKAAALGASSASGLAAIIVMGLLMRAVFKLEDEGTVDIRGAVGQTGTVYVMVPGNKSGVGKIQLELQNRTAEYQAVTFQEQLPTGSKVVVVDVVGPDTVEVIAAPNYGRMTANA